MAHGLETEDNSDFDVMPTGEARGVAQGGSDVVRSDEEDNFDELERGDLGSREV